MSEGHWLQLRLLKLKVTVQNGLNNKVRKHIIINNIMTKMKIIVQAILLSIILTSILTQQTNNNQQLRQDLFDHNAYLNSHLNAQSQSQIADQVQPSTTIPSPQSTQTSTPPSQPQQNTFTSQTSQPENQILTLYKESITPQDPSNPTLPQNQPHEPSPDQHSQYHHYTQKQFWINLSIAALFTCVGAFCSGMTVGLMSIETIQLEIMSLSKDEEQRKIAQRILSVVSNHHLFLVTLLLANAIALESLPLIVHTLMPAWAAILFSTIVVLIGAQIIPQAFCTGPKKIIIAYHAAPIVLVMIKVFWVLGYPMAKGLDHWLGQHSHQRIQHKDFANFLAGESQNLKNTQKLLLTSILQLRTKRVPQIMIPLSDLYMLQLTDKLTSSKIKQINQKDYSYILVYKQKRSNVVGLIKTKQFALKYLKLQRKNLTVENLFVEKQDILCVYEDTNLLEMLMLFQARGERYSIVIGKKKKIEPGVQSIMYSKSDMIANNQEGEILGVVFLNKVLETVSEYKDQVASVLSSIKTSEVKQYSAVSSVPPVQMKQIKKPLL